MPEENLPKELHAKRKPYAELSWWPFPVDTELG